MDAGVRTKSIQSKFGHDQSWYVWRALFLHQEDGCFVSEMGMYGM